MFLVPAHNLPVRLFPRRIRLSVVISLWTLSSCWIFYVFVFVHVGPKHMVNLFLSFIFFRVYATGFETYFKYSSFSS